MTRQSKESACMESGRRISLVIMFSTEPKRVCAYMGNGMTLTNRFSFAVLDSFLCS